MSYFFLSHARADAKDPYFETFVADFLEELRGRIGAHSTDDLGFRDSDSVPLGAAWEPKLERALLVCRTFIAMLSPTYLQRPGCRKEWACFEWRLQTLGGAAPPDLLLPLVWIPIPESDLPPAIERRQRAHGSLGSTYADHGLRCVVRRGGAEYHKLLTALAERVRELVRLPVLPSPRVLVAPDALPDLFEITTPATQPITAVTAASIGGPKHVEFIVVAARQTELQAARHAVTAYGADFGDWYPYLPAIEDRVGRLVQGIAHQEDLTSNLFPVAENLVSYLQGARAKNTLVMLVVDVWSLRLPTYRSYMNLFDRAERFANAGVLVVWNFADDETRDSEHELVDALRCAFPNLTSMKDPLAFHERLGTSDELVEKLRATLCELRRRITDFGAVMRKAGGIAPIAKPLLRGPGHA